MTKQKPKPDLIFLRCFAFLTAICHFYLSATFFLLGFSLILMFNHSWYHILFSCQFYKMKVNKKIIIATKTRIFAEYNVIHKKWFAPGKKNSPKPCEIKNKRNWKQQDDAWDRVERLNKTKIHVLWNDAGQMKECEREGESNKVVSEANFHGIFSYLHQWLTIFIALILFLYTFLLSVFSAKYVFSSTASKDIYNEALVVDEIVTRYCVMARNHPHRKFRTVDCEIVDGSKI